MKRFLFLPSRRFDIKRGSEIDAVPEKHSEAAQGVEADSTDKARESRILTPQMRR